MDIREDIKKKYNTHAEAYHRLRSNPSRMWFNAYMDNPSVLSILKELDVNGKDVLDSGCGSGIFTAQVKKLGAKVIGSDISDKFIEIARRENPSIQFFRYDACKMGFPDAKFDIVCSTLMAHYFEDLNELFCEVHRVLKPNGSYVFSITHPVNAFWVGSWDKIVKGETLINLQPYFVESRLGKWGLNDENGLKVFDDMPFYRHTLEDISIALEQSGFVIEAIREPKPIQEGREVNPMLYDIFNKFPIFLTIKAKRTN